MLASPCHPWQDSAPSWLGRTTTKAKPGRLFPAHASASAGIAGFGAGRAGGEDHTETRKLGGPGGHERDREGDAAAESGPAVTSPWPSLVLRPSRSLVPWSRHGSPSNPSPLPPEGVCGRRRCPPQPPPPTAARRCYSHLRPQCHPWPASLPSASRRASCPALLPGCGHRPVYRLQLQGSWPSLLHLPPRGLQRLSPWRLIPCVNIWS